jgi:hypothetical protein
MALSLGPQPAQSERHQPSRAPAGAQHRDAAQSFSQIPYLVSVALTSPIASAGSPYPLFL